MAARAEPLKNPLEERVGYHLRRASGAMMADLAQRLASLDVTVAEASVLVVIGANPAVSQTEIGRALAIKRANMVPLAAGLMRKGLVVRKAADGRSHTLTLTEAGRRLMLKAEKSMRAHEAHYLPLLGGDGGLRERLKAIWTAR